jgi:LruC domain-containing protein
MMNFLHTSIKYTFYCFLCTFTPLSLGLDVNDLQFLHGSDPSNYSSDGKPLSTYNINSTLPQDVLNNVYSLVPESQYVNSDYIGTDRETNVIIDADLGELDYAEVSITFLNEGAGYRNALGYYIYDSANPPTSQSEINAHIIAFPNASKPTAGSMTQGDTVDLNIQLTDGQALGFFIVSNGWGYSGSYNNIASLGPWSTPFYSSTDLNPETTESLRRHNVVFVDTENEFLVIGFEDIQRPAGDNDFNDLIFTVDVTPFYAIEGVNEDGSTDSIYEPLTQTNNPDAVITSVYPSSNSWATLLFEDRWPFIGDYDFNDMVFKYRVTEQLNGSGDVRGFSAIYKLQAMGASYHNGFAIDLPGLTHSDIQSYSLTLNGVAVGHQILETDNSELVLVIYDDFWQLLNGDGVISNQCPYYKTINHCAASQTQTYEFELQVDFVAPVSRSTLGRPPYNPFVFASTGYNHGDFVATAPGRAWETHLKDETYTQQFNTSLLGLEDDISGYYLKWISANNFPWVLNIAAPLEHPLERVDISLAYPQFSNWVLTSGDSDAKWYETANATPGTTGQ